MNQTFKNYLPLIYAASFFLVLIGILFAVCYIPVFYDWFKGEEIIENHINEIVGNETDDAKIASILMQWVQNNVVYPTNKTLILGIDFYKINGKNKFFWRDAPASWTIIRKMGMCGEDANYFIGVMNHLGFKAKRIEPRGLNHWDHSWAEYYTPQGTKIVVDPSSNQVISPNLKKWAENKSFTSIEAIDLEGNKEDVTREYI